MPTVFDSENDFLLRCDSSRIAKLITLEWALRITARVPGAIVECGVFKGASLATLAALNNVLGLHRIIVGCDTFGLFPEQTDLVDADVRRRFVTEAGEISIAEDTMRAVLAQKGVQSFRLIKGDLCESLRDWPLEQKIAVLNIDVDVYAPTVAIFRDLWPHISVGGIILLDDYGIFPGETRAIDEWLPRSQTIERSPYRNKQAYIQKARS